MDDGIHETAAHTTDGKACNDAAHQSNSKDGGAIVRRVAERETTSRTVDMGDVKAAEEAETGSPVSAPHSREVGPPSPRGAASLHAEGDSLREIVRDAENSETAPHVSESPCGEIQGSDGSQLLLPHCAPSDSRDVVSPLSPSGLDRKTPTVSERPSGTPPSHDRRHLSPHQAAGWRTTPNPTYVGAPTPVKGSMSSGSSASSGFGSQSMTNAASATSLMRFRASLANQVVPITTSFSYVKDLACNFANKLGTDSPLKKILSRLGCTDDMLNGRRSTIDTSAATSSQPANQRRSRKNQNSRGTFKRKCRFNQLEVDGIESAGLIMCGSPLDILVTRTGQVVAVTDLFVVPYLLCFKVEEDAFGVFKAETDLSILTLFSYSAVTIASFFTSYVDAYTGKMVAYFPFIRRHVLRRITFWGDCVNLVLQLLYLLNRDPVLKYAQLFKFTRCWRLLCSSGHFLGGVLWSSVLLSLKEGSGIICVLLVIIHNFGCAWWWLGGGRLVPIGFATIGYPYYHSITEMTLMMMGIATPRSLDWDKPGQLMYVNLSFLTGSVVMAWVFSQFVIIVQRLTMMESHTKSQLALVWSASNSLNIPQHLRTRITGFHRFKAFIKQHAHEELLAGLSRPLLLELKLFLLRHLVKSGAFFADLEPQIISELLLGFDEMCFSPGDLVIKKDDPSNAMFFIIRGVCNVMGDFHGPVVAHLMSGDFFGEMALLFPDSPRTAFVICDSYCMLASITVQAFQKVIEKEPKGVRDIVMRTLADFLRRRVPAHKSFGATKSASSDASNPEDAISVRSFGPKWTQNAKDWVGSVGHVLKDALTLRVGSRQERNTALDVSGGSTRRHQSLTSLTAHSSTGRDSDWGTPDPDVPGIALGSSCPRVNENAALMPNLSAVAVHGPTSPNSLSPQNVHHSRIHDGMPGGRLSVCSNVSTLYMRRASTSNHATRRSSAYDRNTTSNALSAQNSACLSDTIQCSGVSKSSMTPNVDSQHLSTTWELDNDPLQRMGSSARASISLASGIESGSNILSDSQQSADLKVIRDTESRGNVATDTNELLESIGPLSPSHLQFSSRNANARADDPEAALRKSLTRHISMENYMNY